MRASRASIRRGILLNVIDDEDGHRDFVSLLELEPELFLQSIVEGQAAQRRVGGCGRAGGVAAGGCRAPLVEVGFLAEAQCEVVGAVEAGSVDDRGWHVSS